MLLLSALLLILYAYSTYRRLRDISSRRLNRLVMRLLAWAVLALPFTATRAVCSVVYSFDASPFVNPITGVFAVKLVLIFLVQLLATLCLVAGGVMTRNIRIEDERALSSSPATCVRQAPNRDVVVPVRSMRCTDAVLRRSSMGRVLGLCSRVGGERGKRWAKSVPLV